VGIGERVGGGGVNGRGQETGADFSERPVHPRFGEGFGKGLREILSHASTVLQGESWLVAGLI
jgi:hypothetical protein